MKGDRYQPAEGVNSLRLGSILVDQAGYAAQTDAEARLLDLCPQLVCIPGPTANARGKLSRQQLNELAIEAGVAQPDKLASRQAVLDAIEQAAA